MGEIAKSGVTEIWFIQETRLTRAITMVLFLFRFDYYNTPKTAPSTLFYV